MDEKNNQKKEEGEMCCGSLKEDKKNIRQRKIKHQRLWRIFFYSYMWLLPTGQRHLSTIKRVHCGLQKAYAATWAYKGKERGDVVVKKITIIKECRL